MLPSTVSRDHPRPSDIPPARKKRFQQPRYVLVFACLAILSWLSLHKKLELPGSLSSLPSWLSKHLELLDIHSLVPVRSYGRLEGEGEGAARPASQQGEAAVLAAGTGLSLRNARRRLSHGDSSSAGAVRSIFHLTSERCSDEVKIKTRERCEEVAQSMNLGGGVEYREVDLDAISDELTEEEFLAGLGSPFPVAEDAGVDAGTSSGHRQLVAAIRTSDELPGRGRGITEQQDQFPPTSSFSFPPTPISPPSSPTSPFSPTSPSSPISPSSPTSPRSPFNGDLPTRTNSVRSSMSTSSVRLPTHIPIAVEKEVHPDIMRQVDEGGSPGYHAAGSLLHSCSC